MDKIRYPLFTIISLITISLISAQPVNSDQDNQDFATLEDTLTKMSQTFFHLLAAKKTNNLTKYFHFPPNSTPAEKAKDKKYIAAALKAFTKEFGSVSDKKLVTFQEPSQDFRLGSGNMEYWQNHLDFERHIFQVSFSKTGEGYILLDYCNIIGKWQIGFVRFALPLYNPLVRKKFTTIGEIMWSLKQK